MGKSTDSDLDRMELRGATESPLVRFVRWPRISGFSIAPREFWSNFRSLLILCTKRVFLSSLLDFPHFWAS